MFMKSARLKKYKKFTNTPTAILVHQAARQYQCVPICLDVRIRNSQNNFLGGAQAPPS